MLLNFQITQEWLNDQGRFNLGGESVQQEKLPDNAKWGVRDEVDMATPQLGFLWFKEYISNLRTTERRGFIGWVYPGKDQNLKKETMKGMTRCVLKHKRYCHVRNVLGLFSIGTRDISQKVQNGPKTHEEKFFMKASKFTCEKSIFHFFTTTRRAQIKDLLFQVLSRMLSN